LHLDDLTDHEWAIVKTHLARGQCCGRIAPSVLRSTVNGILWRMRTGGPWRFIPSEYGNWSSIRRRFQDWNASSVWQAVTRALAEARDSHNPGPSLNFYVSHGVAREPEGISLPSM
jgi:transposase